MLDVGFSEILLTSAIALIVLGPERLPKVARQVGNWMGRARAMARQLTEQLEREVSAEELLKADQADKDSAANNRRAHARDASAPHRRCSRAPPVRYVIYTHHAVAGAGRRAGRRLHSAPAVNTRRKPRQLRTAPIGIQAHQRQQTRPMTEPGDPGGLAEGTLISHLLELRDRLLKAMLAVGICFVPCAFYMNQIVHVRRGAAQSQTARRRDHHRHQRGRSLHRAVQIGAAACIGLRHALRALPGLGFRRARSLQA